MKGHGVDGSVVPVLVDVNLAITRPVIAVHPESRPGTADGLGQMGELGDEQAMVVLGFALNSDATPALVIGVGDGGIVDTDIDFRPLSRDHTHLLSIRPVSILDVATGRVNIVVVAGTIFALRETS